MISVCHIISGDLWAGAEVVDYHLLKKLKSYNNINLSAILFNEGKLADEIRSLGIDVDIVDETRQNFLHLIMETGKILVRKSPDIIHSHRYKENIVAFLSSKFKSGIRLVSTQHGMPESIGMNARNKYLLLQKFNLYLLSKSFRQVIVVSKDMQRIFTNKYGFNGKNISVIYNGTDIIKNPPNKREKSVFVIGSMGRIYPVKDFPLMVEVAKEVYKETDKIHFELAGDGPDKAKIMDLIERYELGKIFTLKGFVENVSDFYCNLDLYINTSFHEGIPMSILEAMSYKIPIIAPNVGGMKEIFNNGIEGYLVDGRDPKIFADKCLRLYEDNFLRQSMGSSARDKIEKDFSNERMAKEYHQLYLDISHN